MKNSIVGKSYFLNYGEGWSNDMEGRSIFITGESEGYIQMEEHIEIYGKNYTQPVFKKMIFNETTLTLCSESDYELDMAIINKYLTEGIVNISKVYSYYFD